MRFDTYIPSPPLLPFVERFVVQENELAQQYKVIPGAGIVIGFQFKGQLSHVVDNYIQPLAANGISGLQDSFQVFQNTAGTGTVLVYFKDTGAAAFFKEPLHELFGESVSLDNFILRSRLISLEEELCEATNDQQRISIVESFLLSRLEDKAPDQLVLHALACIHRHRGDIRMKDLCMQLHTSQSPLEKRFRQVVGSTPKKFASIVRMKYLLKTYQAGEAFTATAYDAGFYDQAHFIKAFKSFTGETPEQFFKGK